MTITLRYFSLLAAAALAAPLAATAADIVVPDQLQVPTGQKLALDVRGVGVQIYVCSAADGGNYEWRLRRRRRTCSTSRDARSAGTTRDRRGKRTTAARWSARSRRIRTIRTARRFRGCC